MINSAPSGRPDGQSPLTRELQEHWPAGKKQAQIAEDAYLDESYVSKLRYGERTRPSRDALIRLAVFGLELSLPDTEAILLAADYAPLVSERTLR